MLQVEQCAFRSRMEMTGARAPSPCRDVSEPFGCDAAGIGFAGKVMGMARRRVDAD
ncbi:MAG: hypothetical protein IPO75_16115 [Betaproteobacteria bacterium]|nr:hypothetical protein [Betaproteobacteria bacterium]